MKKLLLIFLLPACLFTQAQKKKTINQRNIDELKNDITKAQKGLDMAKGKLAYVLKKCEFIAQKKKETLLKSGSVINADSLLNKIKEQKRRHFYLAEQRVERWQRRYNKLNTNYNLVIQRDSIIPNRHNFIPALQKGVYVSFNPAGMFEVQQGAAGLGLGYRITKNLEFWAEGSYLYRGIGTEGENFRNLRGFKGIVSGRYYYKNKHQFFFGVEIRYKNYTYTDKADFENKSTIDTLFKLQYKLQNTLYGGAALFGKKIKLSRSGKFEIEAIAGLGLKYRFVNYHNVTQGYTIILNQPRYDGINIVPVNYQYTEQWLPYIPATIRLLYHF